MPLDYGVLGRRTTLRGLWLGALPAAAMVAAIVVTNSAYHRNLEVEQGWVGAAQACPTITARDYAARGYAAKERVSVYDGVTIARQFGHLMCKDVDTRGGLGFLTHPVCQFTSPAAIRIRSGAEEAYFEPGPGHLATVRVAHGRAECAIGGRFTLFADPTT